ncbi:MAG: type VI secretion system baseplate subunit TssF [Candidatus Binataceae bacterium]
MLNRYYEQELSHLRQLAAEFSKAHPALAPMLAGPSSDPDVERLLEGVAFLTGLVRARIDDEFPEFIQTLGNLIFPHYLRPIPACTMIAFRAKGRLNEPAMVAPGVEIGSVPVDGTSCIFRTCYPVEVHPLVLRDASVTDRPGAPTAIRLSFTLEGFQLANWPLKSLRFFLGQNISEASLLYFLLSRYVTEIVVSTTDAPAYLLRPADLRPVGFAADEAILPYPPYAYPGYRVLQEYLLMPEKFLFLELTGLDRWENRGGGQDFDIEFRLSEKPAWTPRIRRESFTLNATPAINLFACDAEPIMLDHKRNEYRVVPSARNRANSQIFSIDQVVGHSQGGAPAKTYHRFGLFQASDFGTSGTYEVIVRPAVVERGLGAFLSIAYPEGSVPGPELLTIRLTCTNGLLPDSLHLGDISKPTDNSPERLEFQNITAPTASIAPSAADSLLARLLSHMSLNYLSIANAGNLRALLHLYVFTGPQERRPDIANRRRIDGIQEVRVQAANRIVSGIMMRGQHITLRCRSDHYAGPGDLFLFGVILDRFLADYAALNTYTRVEIEDVLTGDQYRWPERIGQQQLM